MGSPQNQSKQPPLQIHDFNGTDKWSADAILNRYRAYCAHNDLPPLDLSPTRHREGSKCWVYPVMDKVIEGIKSGDKACIQLGIEFICEDRSFAFGRILKAHTARVLRIRRDLLSKSQKHAIRNRVIDMLTRQYLPRELREYVKLAARLGMAERRRELLALECQNPYVNRHVAKLLDSVCLDETTSA